MRRVINIICLYVIPARRYSLWNTLKLKFQYFVVICQHTQITRKREL